MIQRREELHVLRRLLKRHPVVAIVGARQVGKTTLARMLVDGWSGKSHVFDLENPEDLARLGDPMLALRNLAGLVVIDEVQRLPDLFTVLRVLVDRPRSRARFLILGSASPELLRQSSESLAGRIVYRELSGFSLAEVATDQGDRLWQRGGLPRSFLAGTQAESHEWRRAFIATFLAMRSALASPVLSGNFARPAARPEKDRSIAPAPERGHRPIPQAPAREIQES